MMTKHEKEFSFITLNIVLLLVILFLPLSLAMAGDLPDTGQTKCYNNTIEIPCPSPGQPFYGQDAQYKRARSYTKLGQNGAVLADTAAHESGWLMTKDNVTGLVWEMKTDDSGIHDKDNTYTWANAQSMFIATLNQQNFGGYSDWRLPTVKELTFLANSSILYPGPTIDAAWFPSTQSSNYWSSTTYASSTDHAWLVHFPYGHVGNYSKTLSYYVRAVRSGQ